MGYDAFVRCNCWQEGKTKPYPFDYGFHFDFEGFLELDLPPTNADYEKKWIAVDKWIQDCCEHPSMKAEWLRVANQAGMTAFKEALEQIGWEHFPTLRSELPVANEGAVSAKNAAMMLNELIFFLRLSGSTNNARLMETSTGEVVQLHLASREGVFLHDPMAGVDIGVDFDGFFVAKRHEFRDPSVDARSMTYHVQTPRIDLFRAMHFEQRLVDSGKRKAIELMDLDTGTTFLWDASEKVLSVQTASDYRNRIAIIPYDQATTSFTTFPDGVEKRAFHVEVSVRDPHDFDYMIGALFTLCKAAKATGNPIFWR